jgi:hypothetical protein
MLNYRMFLSAANQFLLPALAMPPALRDGVATLPSLRRSNTSPSSPGRLLRHPCLATARKKMRAAAVRLRPGLPPPQCYAASSYRSFFFIIPFSSPLFAAPLFVVGGVEKGAGGSRAANRRPLRSRRPPLLALLELF